MSPLTHDDTVPIDIVRNQNKFYNPITEENSQVEEISENDVTKKAFDYETENQYFEDDQPVKKIRKGKDEGEEDEDEN